MNMNENRINNTNESMFRTKLKRVVIKEELVDITGDYRAALVLNQFLYWTQRMYDTDKYIMEEKERALAHEIDCEIDLTKGWIYKTTAELNEELMINLSRVTLRKIIKDLINLGFLYERRNPKYKWDQTLQYRLDLFKVQQELAKVGCILEGYRLLPGIEIKSDYNIKDKTNQNEKSSSEQNDKEEDFKKNLQLKSNTVNKNITYENEKINITTEELEKIKYNMGDLLSIIKEQKRNELFENSIYKIYASQNPDKFEELINNKIDNMIKRDINSYIEFLTF